MGVTMPTKKDKKKGAKKAKKVKKDKKLKKKKTQKLNPTDESVDMDSPAVSMDLDAPNHMANIPSGGDALDMLAAFGAMKKGNPTDEAEDDDGGDHAVQRSAGGDALDLLAGFAAM